MKRATISDVPRGVPLYGFFSLPRGRLLKVCAEPCMFAPGYIQSNKPRWPAVEAFRAAVAGVSA